MFIITIIIFIPITQQPEQDRLAENQPTAGLSSLNEYDNENEYENGIRKSETELIVFSIIRLKFKSSKCEHNGRVVNIKMAQKKI